MLIKKGEKRTRYVSTGDFNQAQKMSTYPEKKGPFDHDFFQQKLPQYYRVILRDFKKLTRGFVLFNLTYFSLFALELVLFFSFLPLLAQDALFALSLGVLFLTFFSYFVLLFYQQAKKPEALIQLKDQFIASLRQILSAPQGEAEHHLSVAGALFKLSSYLQDFEKSLYKAPKGFHFFSPTLLKISCSCHREDVFKMKKLLLLAAIDEHIKQIRMTPTDLELHSSLAGTYVALSKVYQEARMQDQYEQTARLAIEEFSILCHYAPNDPWVHEQLALGYHDLGMLEEETKELELLLKLRSQDKEVLFRLGSLYFGRGLNAKGLLVYEELKKANFKKAEDLISSYGSFS